MINFTGIALEKKLSDVPSAKEWELRQESAGLIQMIHKHHVDVLEACGVEVIGKFNKNGLQYFAVAADQVKKAQKALRKTIYSTGRVIAEDCGTVNKTYVAGNPLYEHAVDRCFTFSAGRRLGQDHNAQLAVTIDQFAIEEAEKLRKRQAA